LERAVENAHRMQLEHDELLVDPGVIQEDRDAAARSLEHAASMTSARRAEATSAKNASPQLPA